MFQSSAQFSKQYQTFLTLYSTGSYLSLHIWYSWYILPVCIQIRMVSRHVQMQILWYITYSFIYIFIYLFIPAVGYFVIYINKRSYRIFISLSSQLHIIIQHLVLPWFFCHQQGISEGFDSCDRPSNLKLDSNRRFLCSSCDLEISWMTSKNNRALLYYVKLSVSFQTHQWIQSGVTVRKRSIRIEIGKILYRVTLKFYWSWKTIGHLFYTTSSFVYHFKAMGEFNLELQSGNAQFGSKSAFYCPMWPWNLMDDLDKQ